MIEVTVDLDEGRYADLCCVQCHNNEARLRVSEKATLQRWIYGLSCQWCGLELVQYHAFTGVAA